MNHAIGFYYSESSVLFFRFEEEDFAEGSVRDFCISVGSPQDTNDSPTSVGHISVIVILSGVIFCFLLGALFFARKMWLKGNVHFQLRFISHNYVISIVTEITVLPQYEYMNIVTHYTNILLDIVSTQEFNMPVLAIGSICVIRYRMWSYIVGSIRKS
jgi:hypothetical protein